MSDIRLGSSEDLVTFLKLLAEESVTAAKDSLSDPAQENIKKSMRLDAERYKSITEQPDAMQDEMPDEEQPAPEPASSEPEFLEVSLDSITDSIKQLRSGRSVDDSRIRDEMRTYYDRIDESEKQALLAFMRAFSGILTGDLTGASAPDPSSSPYNITMTSGEDGQAPPSAEEMPPEDEDVEPLPPEGEEEDDEEEDTTPPVKVGSPQALAEIRVKIRNLMNAGR
jgi:hypothetical protein